MPLGSDFDIVPGNTYLRRRRVLMDLHHNCMVLTKGHKRYPLLNMASAGVKDVARCNPSCQDLWATLCALRMRQNETSELCARTLMAWYLMRSLL